MKPYPLQTLLELRRREEDAAQDAWKAARGQLEAAEAEAARRAAAATEARRRLDEARGKPDRPAGAHTTMATKDGRITGAAAAGEARFMTRLRDGAARAAAARDAFRTGPLAAARTEERRAAATHGQKRRARESSDRHEAQFIAGEQRGAERREEDARDDVARAARHARTRDPHR